MRIPTRSLVVVEPRDPAVSVDLAAAALALEQASSMLRREVATAITREETPMLKFMVLAAGAEKTQE